jgi:hypothetical protein
VFYFRENPPGLLSQFLSFKTGVPIIITLREVLKLSNMFRPILQEQVALIAMVLKQLYCGNHHGATKRRLVLGRVDENAQGPPQAPLHEYQMR